MNPCRHSSRLSAPGRPTRLAAVALAALSACVPLTVHAQASSGYMPSRASRHAVELLVDRAGLDLVATQWPLPRAAVQRALDALPVDLPPEASAARDLVRAELVRDGQSRGVVDLRGKADILVGYGDESIPGSHVSARSPAVSSGAFAARVGGRLDALPDGVVAGGRFDLEGTELDAEAAGLQLEAWQRRQWWGPSWDSALALSNNAPAFVGVGVQRASASRSASPWLSWMGPWNFESFIAQTESETRPNDPFIVGSRLTLRPWPALELGFTEMLQWGGAGRPQSIGSLLKSMVGWHVNVGADTPGGGVDTANLLGGYDVRLRCPADLGCALYGQVIGEDERHRRPARFITLAGAEWATPGGEHRFFTEYVDTTVAEHLGGPALHGVAYRNTAYPQGYADGQRWIGASVGPDSRVFSAGWIDVEDGQSLRLRIGQVGSRIGTYADENGAQSVTGDLAGVSWSRDLHWGAAVISPSLDWQRVAGPQGVHVDRRVGLALDVPLGAALAATGGWLGDTLSLERDSGVKALLVGGLLVAASASLDHPLDDYAYTHGDNRSARTLHSAGSMLPFAMSGLAAADWLVEPGTRAGRTSFSALEASVAAVGTGELLKLAVDRSRPTAQSGALQLNADHQRTSSSFPSLHSALAWAVVTPYAEQYDAPWLYGVAALTNAARVMGHDHWFSDTVAGALIGWAWGDFLVRRPETFGVAVGPRSVALHYTY